MIKTCPRDPKAASLEVKYLRGLRNHTPCAAGRAQINNDPPPVIPNDPAAGAATLIPDTEKSDLC